MHTYPGYERTYICIYINYIIYVLVITPPGGVVIDLFPVARWLQIDY